MNLDIRELTSSLSSYSSGTNQAVTAMADAVRPIGYILLGLKWSRQEVVLLLKKFG